MGKLEAWWAVDDGQDKKVVTERQASIQEGLGGKPVKRPFVTPVQR